MKIEILFIDGCPHHHAAAERVREALREEGLSAEVVEVNMKEATTAARSVFLGSPTITIDGLDIDPSARSSREFGISCRTYLDGGRRTGLPSRELIRAALREARGPQP